MNNAINEIKNTLEATNSKITEAEDRISELEDRMVEINELQTLFIQLCHLAELLYTLPLFSVSFFTAMD